MTGEEVRARDEALLSAHALIRERCGDYKPVPDDYRDLLERLVDAAEDVIAWHEVLGGDMTDFDCRDAVSRLGNAVATASTYLEGTS